MTMDIDGPPLELRFEGHFKDAWIVLCRSGVPLGISVLDLTADVQVNWGRLQEDIARARAVQSETSSNPPPTVALPRISVVVPTIAHNIDELALCVESLGELDYPDFEVLLVDNRRVVPEPDPLTALARNRPWLRVIREATPGISAARNKGVAESNADFIAFTDDDVRVDREWLRSIATRLLREPGLDAGTGLLLPAELESAAQIWFERYFGGFGGVRSFRPVTLELEPTKRTMSPRGRLCERDAKGIVRQHSSLYGVGRYVAGANMTFRKSALEGVHGFDVALGTGTPSRGGEDLAAIINVLWKGGRVGYEPSAFVYHRHRRDYADLLKQLDGSGLGFTAMLTSLVRADPRHLLALGVQMPLALARISVQGVERLRGKQIGERGVKNQSPAHLYPSTLFAREFLSYLRGPLAYARSSAASKRT